jgi:hypothetical protein
MIKRYQGLRLVGLILKIAGGLEMAFGVVSVVLIPLILSGAQNALVQLGFSLNTPAAALWIGIAAGIVILFVGVVTGLLTFALGELINVVVDIEMNTRTSAGIDSPSNA